ncbi:MAG TPA: hypothetical protein ENH10_02810 [Bacteroidetes bacterium]|nr:hypothetical protein [Bacteroidota bacterium]HEX04071.1 hypothetical protein [Bacteroidota bacterium]
MADQMNTEAWQLTMRKLAYDRKRGATELVVDAVDCLLEGIAQPGLYDPSLIRKTLTTLRYEHTSMAPILNLTAEICYWLDTQDQDLDRTALVNKMRRDIEKIRERYVTDNQQFQDKFRSLELTGPRFGFYSWSSTVALCMNALAGIPVGAKAFVGQSIPGGEGKKTAKMLAKLGWSTWLISDTHLADMAKAGKINTLILGCDAYDDTSFVNKIGSGALAALVKAAGQRVEIWTHESKRLNSSEIHELNLGKSEPEPPVSTGIAIPTPLFGTGSLSDIDVIRTPEKDHTPESLREQTISRPSPLPDYLKLENRPG